jgi:hypothetical protein
MALNEIKPQIYGEEWEKMGRSWRKNEENHMAKYLQGNVPTIQPVTYRVLLF